MPRCADIDLTNFIGPLLDDGAPYSGIGLAEFTMLQEMILSNWSGEFDPLLDDIKDRPLWQYGTGSHASETRKFLGSILLKCSTKINTDVMIRHLIIEGSSQWVIGRNLTKHCDIVHIDGKFIKLPNCMKVEIVNLDLHSYLPYSFFCPGSATMN
eukprot:IDg2818t1